MQSEAEKLIEEVARLISPVAFGCTPSLYGLADDDTEGFERTFAYGAQLVALKRARAVTALIVDRCAGAAAGWRNPQAVKLAAGEMTAQELRTALAVAGGIEAAIRSLIPEAPQPEDKEAREDE